ncbi:ANTAR domain-containing protein [Occultella glacieicola]|uniref:ANTAR domain-containing protein n=1 Tax=Occultella glacieicola TaxID=2518684 RepID=A0ABY2E2C0_9MICO|nr:GAF and ANTAR domain-containing protein [Occultella glacieicola]TDE92760.1 ANTAR domain-containing protein [Occultella glacieicola]
MYDHTEFVRTTSDFARKLVRPYDVYDVVSDLVERLTDLLGLAGSGVSVEVDGRLRAITTIPEQLVALERAQEETQVGPCVDAFATGEIVVVNDLEAEVRWPLYREQAGRIGVRSVVGIPMHLGEQPVGALNLYEEGPRYWADDDLLAARVLADLATGFLINASLFAKQDLLTGQLQYALESRIIIEQAKGVIAEARDLPVAEAFEVMRAHARARNLRMNEVARAVVEDGLRP